MKRPTLFSLASFVHVRAANHHLFCHAAGSSRSSIINHPAVGASLSSMRHLPLRRRSISSTSFIIGGGGFSIGTPLAVPAVRNHRRRVRPSCQWHSARANNDNNDALTMTTAAAFASLMAAAYFPSQSQPPRRYDRPPHDRCRPRMSTTTMMATMEGTTRGGRRRSNLSTMRLYSSRDRNGDSMGDNGDGGDNEVDFANNGAGGAVDIVVSSIRKSLLVDLVAPHLEQEVAAASKKNADTIIMDDLPPPTTLVLVLAVSGGCDSTALFHAVMESSSAELQTEEVAGCDDGGGGSGTARGARRRLLRLSSDDDAVGVDVPLEVEVHVAHFNHEQRDEESDGDEAFVAELCRERDVPLHRFSWSETSRTAEESAESESESFSQDVARKWRRRELHKLLSDLVLGQHASSVPSSSASGDSSSRRRWGAIATAHHRDDADETILLKLLRGSHLTSLRGMDATSDGFDLLRGQEDDSDGGEDLSENSHHSRLSPVGYFVKPMLGVRKSDIASYLVSNGLEWREDASNASNKYKRNIVRNKLMPLLADIAGGERALQRRFLNLEQQSRDISRDLTARAEAYLQSMASFPSHASVFDLPPNPESSFDLVHEKALHLWIDRRTTTNLPYRQLLRLREQITEYPERRQWTMDVGGSWSVERKGDVLYVRGDGDVGVDDNVNNVDSTLSLGGSNSSSRASQKSSSSCFIVETNDAGNHSTTSIDESRYDLVELSLHFPPTSPSSPPRCDSNLGSSSSIVMKNVEGNAGMVFVPPWRRGRSPVKVKEFLRGQKVPLHERGDVPILCYRCRRRSEEEEGGNDDDDNDECVVAVFVPQPRSQDGNITSAITTTGGKWVVHADFQEENNGEETNRVKVVVAHQRTC